MKRLLPSFLYVFLCISLISCSGENLYEFEELSAKEDYVIQIVAIAADSQEPMTFSTIFYETDGYGDLLEAPKSFGGNIGKYWVFRTAVKEYKKAGVKFIPQENIQGVQVEIFNLESGDHVFARYFEEITGPVTVFYDFDKEEETVVQE